MQLDPGQTLYGFGGVVSNLNVANFGVIGGPLANGFGNLTFNLGNHFMNNSGVIDANGGTITINTTGGFTNSGTMTEENGGKIILNTSSLSNAGSLTFNAGTTNISGTFTAVNNSFTQFLPTSVVFSPVFQFDPTAHVLSSGGVLSGTVNNKGVFTAGALPPQNFSQSVPQVTSFAQLAGQVASAATTTLDGFTLGVPAISHITGDYNQFATGILVLTLGGTTPGGATGGYDQLAVTGNVAFQPGATIDLLLNYAPHIGDKWNLVTAGGKLDGGSATIDFLNAPAGFQFSESLTGGVLAVTVTGVPEPSTVIIATLGGLALLAWRRGP